MNKTFRIHVFGKQDCDKCKALNRRLDKMLGQDTWADFEKVYHDLGTIDGLVQFCHAEGINPQRIPAMTISRKSEDGRYEPVPNQDPPSPEQTRRLHSMLGLQTDYSAAGKGVLPPAEIEAVLSDALQHS